MMVRVYYVLSPDLLLSVSVVVLSIRFYLRAPSFVRSYILIYLLLSRSPSSSAALPPSHYIRDTLLYSSPNTTNNKRRRRLKAKRKHKLEKCKEIKIQLQQTSKSNAVLCLESLLWIFSSRTFSYSSSSLHTTRKLCNSTFD